MNSVRCAPKSVFEPVDAVAFEPKAEDHTDERDVKVFLVFNSVVSVDSDKEDPKRGFVNLPVLVSFFVSKSGKD